MLIKSESCHLPQDSTAAQTISQMRSDPPASMRQMRFVLRKMQGEAVQGAGAAAGSGAAQPPSPPLHQTAGPTPTPTPTPAGAADSAAAGLAVASTPMERGGAGELWPSGGPSALETAAASTTAQDATEIPAAAVAEAAVAGTGGPMESTEVGAQDEGYSGNQGGTSGVEAGEGMQEAT